MTEITLTPQQVEQAVQYAVRVDREARARNQARTIETKKTDRSASSLGYKAQLAFCLMLGFQWNPKIDYKNANVGQIYKVRGRQRHAGNPSPALLVREKDRDDLVFVHVTTEDGVTFRCEGWIRGADAKREGKRSDFGYGPSYAVQRSLRSMESLPIDHSLDGKKPEDAKTNGDSFE